jgi:undecaprenyl-diphosphatase
MTIGEALLLGLVQGFAELLPVSSSAHLALAPLFFGFRDPGLAFDVALHLGTLIALAWYFRRDWIACFWATLSVVRTRRVSTLDERRALYLVVATIPAGIAGLLLNDLAESAFRSPLLIACTLAGMGVLLWAADRYAPQTRTLEDITLRDAVLVGVAQVFALVPGVSRSGSTMTAGRALALDRPTAARFSFLMSMPITLAAVALKVPEVIAAEGVSAPLVTGIVAAALSSWLAITVLLRYVGKHSFGIFAWYRVLLAAVVVYVVLRSA